MKGFLTFQIFASENQLLINGSRTEKSDALIADPKNQKRNRLSTSICS